MIAKRFYIAYRNPSATSAEWPKLWRSHAAYVSQFGSVGAKFTRVMQCSRVVDGSAIPGGDARCDGIAVLSCPSLEESVTADLPPDVRAKIDTDELRVFATLVEPVSMTALEHVVADNGFDAARERAGVITFLKARAGVSRAELARIWKEQVAPALLASAAMKGKVVRCVLNESVGETPPGCDYDAVAEVWFADASTATAAFAAAGADGTLSRLDASLDKLVDATRTLKVLTRVTHTWSAAA